MDRKELSGNLRERFGAGDGEARAVARQAGDLADSGRYQRDVGTPLTPAAVVRNLEDAPDEGVAAKWNWWMGALELAYGGYAEFQVRQFST